MCSTATRRPWRLAWVPLLGLLAGCAGQNPVSTVHAPVASLELIPLPVELQLGSGVYTLRAADPIREQLLASYDPVLGAEGYRLTVDDDGIQIDANTSAGLYYGRMTLRQLLPVDFPGFDVFEGGWQVPYVAIVDYPRFAWRGYMLDVARHFFPPAALKRWIDVLAAYKINILHLHLTDDQGWRIAIAGRERLTQIGGAGAVGDSAGGYYSAGDFADIVAYAAARAMQVVPEIDMPGHTHAALASYAELNCTGEAPAPYTGTQVGISSLCLSSDATATTYGFVDAVLDAMAGMSPAPYLHIGADEAHQTDELQYREFVGFVRDKVAAYGKITVAWEEAAHADISSATLLQVWLNALDISTLPVGVQLIASPATRAYLDMRYDADTTWGTVWAGYVDMEQAYDWDPVMELRGATEAQIIGIEGALWTENVPSEAAVEYMTFPRLLGYAEIGWSVGAGRNWAEYRGRLASHGDRLRAAGVRFYAAPEIDW